MSCNGQRSYWLQQVVPASFETTHNEWFPGRSDLDPFSVDQKTRSYPLQVTETEIILPLNIQRNISPTKRDLLSLCVGSIFMPGVGIFLLIPHGGLIPTTGEGPLSLLLIVLSILVLLPSLTALAIVLQGDSSRSSRFVRINHEGVFFTHLFPTVVKWSEISTLVPYTRTYLGHRQTALGGVPQDPEAIIARILDERSRNFLSRFFSRINRYLYRRSNALSPLPIPQVMVPISIDELIALIQERFANELSEHHVTILGWQAGNG
jgi:hypothetical protein